MGGGGYGTNHPPFSRGTLSSTGTLSPVSGICLPRTGSGVDYGGGITPRESLFPLRGRFTSLVVLGPLGDPDSGFSVSTVVTE